MLRSWATKEKDLVFEIISELGDKFGVALYMCIGYNTLSLTKAYIVLTLAAGSIGLTSILKSIYDEPRPFFVSDIRPSSCRFEHGNPSGHAIIFISVVGILIKMIIREYKIRGVKKNISWALYFMVALLVGYARI